MNFTGGTVYRNFLEVRIAGERFKNLVKKVIVAPQMKSGIHGFPRAKPYWQITPEGTCFHFPKHAIQHHPIGLDGLPSPLFSGGNRSLILSQSWSLISWRLSIFYKLLVILSL
nr:hypothetical protein [Paenibacillus tundrae]